jgi:tRNA-splicing ligase RtcB (3'-phosphate/5'-hydroxy nucleic acid ligase)
MVDIKEFSLKKIGEVEWVIDDKNLKRKVKIFATEKLLKEMDDEVFIQARNVATLPGLFGDVYVMPDAHSGYGAPIGTVFAMDEKEGFVSPGAVGYDINCGMRLITTNLTKKEILPFLEKLVNKLFEKIPVGVGKSGFLKINKNELKNLAEKGVPYFIEKFGLGWKEDIKKIEEEGVLKNADFSKVSKEAIERGISQLATLGSGNHYLEIQKVEEIFDKDIAKSLGIFAKDQITVMIHCGSRGFGHQICSDYLRLFEKNLARFKIKVADRQLACAPINSSLGKDYLLAMSAAVNFAFVNRQAITYKVRKVFEEVLGKDAKSLSMNLVYDVAHNVAKFETHNQKKLLIHRKGATRSFPGQPVIIGGSMETGSFLLLGEKEAMEKSFGSTAHGSGRTMSRAKAKKLIHGEKLLKQLKEKGIYVKAASFSGVAEEAGFAYKNIEEVVKSVALAGLSKPVAYFKPIGNIKG